MEQTKQYAPHQQRVVDEAKELVIKLDSLTEFIIKNPMFSRLDELEKIRLQKQLCAMGEYSDILHERIDAF